MRFNKVKANNLGIAMEAAKGHFATNHSHVNYYIDLTAIKTRISAARSAAEYLADFYQETVVDTVLCLEGTEAIGAFLAAWLAKDSFTGINAGADIAIITPELNASGQLVFRGSAQQSVHHKNTLLLMSSVSTGKTVKRALECLSYYGALPVGVCALFSAAAEGGGFPIHAVFGLADVQGYQTYSAGECELCARGDKLDAIVNDRGYSEL